MKTILIIGNGFDLANCLPTSYKDFFESLILKIIENPNGYRDFVRPIYSSKDLESFLKQSNKHTYPNKFFELLTKDFVDKNWCDIETLYFTQLKNLNDFNNLENISMFEDIYDLNNQFERIKDELELYLSALSEPNLGHDFFKKILNSNFYKPTTILNFNYTKTLEKYINPNNFKIINIHGELNSNDNPIIFGYAATESQIKDFRNIDTEYMRNIKRTNYTFTGNYRALHEIINDNENYNVLILGHSCGKSDQLILSQIFNNKNLKLIEIVYYNKEEYFQQIVKIENLIEDEDDYNKFVEFDKSLRMPQKNDNEDYEETLQKYSKNRRL